MRLEDRLQQAEEDQTLELKSSLAGLRSGLEALCGMLNADRGEGTLAFGVGPDGAPVGLEGSLDEAQRRISERIRDGFEPRLRHEIDVAVIEERPVLVVRATRDRSVQLYTFRERAYLREGAHKRVLSLDEAIRLRALRDRRSHNGPWRCDGCGSVVQILASPVITMGPRGPEVTGYNYSHQCGGEYWPLV